MSVLNRGVQYIWSAEATGIGGASTYAVVGAQTNVAVHVTVSGATTISVQAAFSANRSAGRNYDPGDTDAHPFYSNASSVLVPLEFVFSGAGKASFDVSPYTPNFLRLVSSNDVTATAVVEVVG